MRDILDTDFLEGLRCTNEFGEIYGVKEYLKQIARYIHCLEDELLHYEERNDVDSVIEIRNEHHVVSTFFHDIRRCEREVKRAHE